MQCAWVLHPKPAYRLEPKTAVIQNRQTLVMGDEHETVKKAQRNRQIGSAA
jgi:hypothetical protein